MKIDFDLMQVREANIVERVGINMAEITGFDMEAEDEASESNEIEVVYPKVSEGLLEFLHRCKVEDSKVMLCHMCSFVFFIRGLERKWRVLIRLRGRKTRGGTSLSFISTRGESLGKRSSFLTTKEASVPLMCQHRMLPKGGG